MQQSIYEQIKKQCGHLLDVNGKIYCCYPKIGITENKLNLNCNKESCEKTKKSINEVM